MCCRCNQKLIYNQIGGFILIMYAHAFNKSDKRHFIYLDINAFFFSFLAVPKSVGKGKTKEDLRCYQLARLATLGRNGSLLTRQFARLASTKYSLCVFIPCVWEEELFLTLQVLIKIFNKGQFSTLQTFSCDDIFLYY